MKPGSFLLLTLLLFFLYPKIAAQTINKKEYCNDYPIDICMLTYEPVCGSDGKTYGNRCFFCVAYVESGRRLQLRHLGECKI